MSPYQLTSAYFVTQCGDHNRARSKVLGKDQSKAQERGKKTRFRTWLMAVLSVRAQGTTDDRTP